MTAPITLLSIPKAFVGHAAVIQTNAVLSWARLVVPRELVLCGCDDGVREMADRVGARHLADLARSELGTPYVTDALRAVVSGATTPWVCYVNADIVLDGSIARAVHALDPARPTLLVGQRTDTDVDHLIDFGRPDPGEAIRALAREGVLSHTNAIDYFCFTPGSWMDGMPRFIVGRPGWDNWFLYNAIRRGVRVVDGTRDVLAVHQNHDYGHIPESAGHAWEGPEANYNRRQIGSHLHYFTIDHATHLLVNGRVRRALEWRHLETRLARLMNRPPLDSIRRSWRWCRHAAHFGLWLLRYHVLGPMRRAIVGGAPRRGGPPRWRLDRHADRTD